MSALVEEYEQCGETQMGFCQRQGLALSSFQAGLRRRRQQKANARTIRFNPSAQDRPLWDDNDSVLHFFPAEDDRFQTLQRSRGPERKRLSCFKAGNLMIYKIKPTIAIRAQVRLIFSETESIGCAWVYVELDPNGYEILIAQSVDN